VEEKLATSSERGASTQAADAELSQHLQLLKALSNPIRLHLMGILSYRDISPSQFARLRGEPVSNVNHHFEMLKKLDCIELAYTRPNRGSVEHIYRRTATVVFDDDGWLEMPDEARRVVASSIVRDLFGRMSQAIQSGTFTARKDTHITWRPVNLDEQGWNEVATILTSTFHAVGEAEVRAAKRLVESGESSVSATVALAGFESPRVQIGDDQEAR
jgi:hypothetical protein